MYYYLERDYKSNWEWNVIILKEDNSKLKDIFLEKNNELKLFLISNQKQILERELKAFDTDFIYWTDDLTLGAFPPALSNCFIISKRFKNVLESFILPRHFYFDCKVINAENKIQNDDFLVLHFPDSLNDYTDFEKSHYAYRIKGSEDIMKFEIGIFKSYLEYSEASKISRRKNGVIIEISKRSLVADFDVIGGVTNVLRIKENVKDKLESENIRGVKFTLLDDYEIIIPSTS